MARNFARLNKVVSFNPTFPMPNLNKLAQFSAKLQPEDEFVGRSHELEVFLNDDDRTGFQIDPKFVLQDSLHRTNPITGHCTPSGTVNFTQRHVRVHSDNFKRDNTGRFLSRLVYGTATGEPTAGVDFRQYNCLKHAIMSGVNQIDTGHSFRGHRSEHVVGLVLRTLVHKYGMDRAEVNVISKQGWVGGDSINEVPKEILVREIINSTGLR